MAAALTWREGRRRSRLFRREEGLQAFLRKQFRDEMGFEADLTAPRRFSERLLFLRLFDRDPLQPVLAAYPEQREYLRAKRQERALAKVWAEGDTFRDIVKQRLPDRVVLRPTHLPEGTFTLRPRNRRAALQAARGWYGESAFLRYAAWEYRDVPHGLVAESPIRGGVRVRILCLGGEPRLFVLIGDDSAAYDATGSPLYGAGEPFRPDGLEHAMLLARALGGEFPFLRVDAVLTGGRAIFQGLRFFEDWSSLQVLPPALDAELGSFLPLPQRPDR